MPIPLFFIMALIAVAASAASILLQPKPKLENARPAGVGEFKFPTATEARAVPIIWGTMDVKGPNVIWYGDLQTTKVKRKIKTGLFSSKQLTIAISYKIGMDLLLGYGPLNRVTRFEADSVEMFDGSIDMIAAGDAGHALVIDRALSLGGKGKGGGIVGTFQIYGGTPDQEQNPYLQSVLGDDIPGYPDIAHVVAQKPIIGENETVGPYIFRVSRYPDSLSLDATNHIVNGTADDGDANPAEVIYEILTSSAWGLNLPASDIDIPAFTTAGNTLFDEGNGWSSLQDEVIEAIEMIDEVLRQIDGVLVEDSEGKYTLKLVRDDYVLSTTPIFDESNIVEVRAFSRSAWSQTQNHIAIGFTDATQNYIDTSAVAQDTANQEIQGADIRADMKFPGIKDPGLAASVAARELHGAAFPLALVELECNREAASLIPGDVIRFSNLELGVVEMPIRIAAVSPGTLQSGTVILRGIQDIFRLPGVLMSVPQDSGWVPSDNSAIDSFFQIVREAPRLMNQLSREEFVDPDTSDARIWSGAVGANGVQLFYDLFVDTGGGAGFEGSLGTANNMTPSGLLQSEYPIGTADVDTTGPVLFLSSGLNDGTIDGDLLENVDAAAILGGANLALIEGPTQAEDEIIGWETIVDLGGTFRLDGVHRGLFDTIARTHPINSRVWFINDLSMTLGRDTYSDTQSITAKHVPQTRTEILPLADATALPLTFAQRTLRPAHMADLTVEGSRLPAVVSQDLVADDLDFAWSDRMPDLDTEVLDADVATPGSQDTDVEYLLDFRHAVTDVQLGSLITKDDGDGAGWLTHTYAGADLRTDTGEVGDFPLRVRTSAKFKSSPANGNPADLASLVEGDYDFVCDIGGGTKQSVEFDTLGEEWLQTTLTDIGVGNVWSFSVWLRPDDLDATASNIFLDVLGFGDTTIDSPDSMRFLVNSPFGGDVFVIQLWDSSGTLFKSWAFSQATEGVWSHIVVTWDGTDLHVYHNGVEDTSPILGTDDSGTMANTSRNITIGQSQGEAGLGQFIGLIHQVAFWTTVLSPDEIAAMYNGGDGDAFNLRNNSGNYVSRDTLDHLWDFRKSGDLTLGQDYGNSSALLNVTDAANNITAADDLVSGTPT